MISLISLLIMIGCNDNSPKAVKAKLKRIAIDSAFFMYYGKNEKIDRLFRLTAKAEGWEFVGQPDKYPMLTETGNDDAPFIGTTFIMFSNPKDKDTIRSLQM